MNQSGGVTKKCVECGKQFVAVQAHFVRCSDCQRAAQGSRQGPPVGPSPTRGASALPGGYLTKG